MVFDVWATFCLMIFQIFSFKFALLMNTSYYQKKNFKLCLQLSEFDLSSRLRDLTKHTHINTTPYSELKKCVRFIQNN